MDAKASAKQSPPSDAKALAMPMSTKAEAKLTTVTKSESKANASEAASSKEILGSRRQNTDMTENGTLLR
jgi:hypothetical protein